MKHVVWVLAILAGCSTDRKENDHQINNGGANNTPPALAVDVRLPKIQGEDGADCFDGDRVVLSGGDLVAMTDRIVVADLTDVRVIDAFAEASSLEDGLSRCAESDVRLTLEVRAKVVENLHGTGDSFSFTIGPEEHIAWTSHPRFRFNDQWLPDESAYQGEPLPRIQTTEDLGWTGETGVQAGQRLVLFLTDNAGLTPTVFPMGEVGDDEVVHFQTLDLPSACLSMPAAFQGGTLEEIRTSLQELRVAIEWDKFSYPASQMNFCAQGL